MPASSSDLAATDKPLDAVIVGAGPAGLTAAIFLKRFRRRIAVIDAGQSRGAWIPRTRNHPGFPEGVGGIELLARLKAQLAAHGGALTAGAVGAVHRRDDAFRVELADGSRLGASHLLIATGVVDVEPPVPNALGAVRAGLIRQCPICDGYEAIDCRIVVIGRGALGLGEALFLRTYSADITLVTLGTPLDVADDARARMAAAGIRLVETPLLAIATEDDRIARLDFVDGASIATDLVYSALGVEPRAELAAGLGIELTPDKCIVAGSHQRTAIEGAYAAGDVVTGLNQLAVAMAQGEIAAVDIHNRLRAAEGLRLGE